MWNETERAVREDAISGHPPALEAAYPEAFENQLRVAPIRPGDSVIIKGEALSERLSFDGASRVEPRVHSSHALPEGSVWDFLFYRKPRSL